jgi:hypothetical protein
MVDNRLVTGRGRFEHALTQDSSVRARCLRKREIVSVAAVASTLSRK